MWPMLNESACNFGKGLKCYQNGCSHGMQLVALTLRLRAKDVVYLDVVTYGFILLAKREL